MRSLAMQSVVVVTLFVATVASQERRSSLVAVRDAQGRPVAGERCSIGGSVKTVGRDRTAQGLGLRLLQRDVSWSYRDRYSSDRDGMIYIPVLPVPGIVRKATLRPSSWIHDTVVKLDLQAGEVQDVVVRK